MGGLMDVMSTADAGVGEMELITPGGGVDGGGGGGGGGGAGSRGKSKNKKKKKGKR
jgi:hypothetical protein